MRSVCVVRVRMPNKDKYRARAEECRRKAEAAVRANDRKSWLDLSSAWMMLAQQPTVEAIIAKRQNDKFVPLERL